MIESIVAILYNVTYVLVLEKRATSVANIVPSFTLLYFTFFTLLHGHIFQLNTIQSETFF